MQQFRLTVIFPAMTFALAGTFLSTILLVQHGRAERGECGAGCADVLSSRWAYFPPSDPTPSHSAGVPVALLGVVYFAGFALWLLVVGKVPWKQRLWHSVPMAVSWLGALVSIVLISGMAFMETWCPLCLAVHVVNLALVPYIYFCRPEQSPEDPAAPAIELRPVLTGGALVVCAGAAIWFGYDSFRHRERNQALSTALARAKVQSFQGVSAEVVGTPHASPTGAAPVASSTDDEWVITSSAADPDTVVVYTDLLCPHCRAFEERLLQVWAPKFRDHLNVAIKHFPLCAQCNHGSADVHPWACEAAYLAEAARVVGGSEAFLRVMRAIHPRRSQPWTEDDAITLAIEAGLNPQRFLDAWQSDAVRDRVARDIAEARQLGVAETPAVFVNGQRLDRQTRDLPEYWEHLAARPRQSGRTSSALADQSSAPRAAAPPAGSSEPLVHAASKPAVPSNQVPEKPVTTNQATTNHTTANHTTANQATANQATANHVTTNQGAANQATTNHVTTNQGAANHVPKISPAQQPPAQQSERSTTVAAAPASPSAKVPAASQPPSEERRQRVARTMLNLYDANKDGALQPDEWGKLYGNGAKIDTNNDQKITLDEIVAGIVELHGGADEEAAPSGAAEPSKSAGSKPAPESPRISTIYTGDQLDISGPTLDGRSFNLREQRGKPVLVAFWSSWCPHCIDETPELLRLYRKYHDLGLEIVGVNGDISTASAREFVAKNQIPWPQIHFTADGERGRGNPLARRYNVRGYPAMFLLDGEGKVTGVHLRGNELETAIAQALGVRPTPPEVAQKDRAELAATLFRPQNVPQEKNFSIEVGDRPHIVGPTLDGSTFDLSQYRGQPVLVAFWATWCPHCKREMPVIKEVYERYRDQGLVVVGVSADRKKADLETYLAANPVPWPNIFFDDHGLRGFNNPLVYWHGVRGVPALFLVDREGKVAAVRPRGDAIDREVAKVLGVAPATTPASAPLQALAQLLTGTPTANHHPADTPTAEHSAATNSASTPPKSANSESAIPAPTNSSPVSTTPAASTPAHTPPAASTSPPAPTEPATQPAPATTRKNTFDTTPAPVLAQGVIKRYDANGDGILQKAEFLKIPGDFAKYDNNKDDLLSLEELTIAIGVAQRLKQVLPSSFPTVPVRSKTSATEPAPAR
uniref:Redoxin domain-containing protein n=1 Tax=Schlesneria paludicola TaxID=360056 RepID=A0A7C4QQ42_9PLAN